MIRTFKSKALADFWSTKRSRKIDARMHERLWRRLEALDKAKAVTDLNVPGFDFHALHRFRPTRYSLHVNGPWCVTFEFDAGDAFNVEFEQYH